MTIGKLVPSLRALLLAALALALSGVVAPQPARAQQSAPAAQPPAGYDQITPGDAAPDALADVVGPIHAMIELTDEPTIVTTTRAARARGVDARQAGRTQKNRIERAQQTVLGQIRSAGMKARVLYQVQSAYNGIAVHADGATLRQIRNLPGVKDVRPLMLLERTNAVSVPLIGGARAWELLAAGVNLTGRGVRVGVIDTGIDYVHSNFGGSGSAADLAIARSAAANPPAVPGVVPPGFAVSNGSAQLYPSVKVVGGFDFAGDNYNAAAPATSTPAPDPNPLDCPSVLGGGHGSHVAGTAAGYGVNADGSTYTGPWNTTTPFSSLRIGPGVAPEAQLYALRVFGCTGSTALTTQAIDWAVDPNRDGDTSDRLDVINMSLGSAYGSPDDPSAQASENAAAAGVIVVASAGNSSDLYYISGSPGSSARTLTVASSVDSTDIADGFDVLSPSSIAGVYASFNSQAYNFAGNAPTTAPLFYPATNRNACATYAAGSLAGRVVLIDWFLPGQTVSGCGSAVRVANAAAAGAVGVIMVYNQPFVDIAIAGTASIPATVTTAPTGDLLKTALGAGAVQVRLGGQYAASQKIVVPARTDTLSTFSSRGPRGRDNALKPDISAPGQSIFSTDSGTGTFGKSLNGTSMAAPHMAGVMALLKQKNPGWTVEELKALAMNTAGSDIYSGFDATSPSVVKIGPARVGAGRVQVDTALSNDVVAFNNDGSGAVSVSFGAVEVPGTLTLERTVRVVNKGAAPASYTLGYDARTTIPGVGYSFPDGSTITVPAGGSATFRVQLSADASLMKNTRDASVDGAQGGNPRQWLSEASGLITLTPASGTTLRVPVYAAARPSSTLSTTASTITVPGATLSGALTLAGQGVSTGPLGSGEYNSLAWPLELQGVSPQLSAPPAGFAPSSLNADLQYIGVTASPSQVFFGVTTWRDFGTPATDIQFSIYIDRDRNGTDDLLLFNTRLTDTDVFATALAVLPSTSGSLQTFLNLYNSNIPTAAMNNNVAVLPVNIASLGLSSGSTRFNYRVESFSRFNGVVDTAGPFTFDVANRGLDYSGGSSAAPVYTGQAGANIPLAYNQARYLANNSRGGLLLHPFNTAGNRTQVLPVVGQVSISAPATFTYGYGTFTVSASVTTPQSVTLSSLTPAVCTISGNTVTPVGVGACTIRAASVATANFGVATADATITILEPAPTVVFGTGPRSLCQVEPGELAVQGRVILPPGRQALVQTSWYIVNPADRSTTPVYQISGPVQNGDTFTVQAQWPGIRPTDTVVQTYVGAILLDPITRNPIMNRGASTSYYWYPWVCAAPSN
ncbi:MAG TPA: S8 family serine peptidase [Roseiflexaceae bacterium]|nr:S8 family serine peptidase [Roseiflexaceae bacterium]